MTPRNTGRRRALHMVVTACVTALVVMTTTWSPALAAQHGLWWQSLWRMPEVWQASDGAGVIVAVYDSGVDAAAPDLAGAVIPGISLTGESDDGTVDTHPYRHGTDMAMLIAGRGTHSGLVGVAPAATILPIAAALGVLPDVPAEHSEALRYAVDNGARVINVSSGALSSEAGRDCPERVAAAVRYAISQDVIVVAASGNTADGEHEYPASCPGVLTVGGVDQNLEPWEDSHRSPYVDVAAPGVDIAGLTPEGQIYEGPGTSNSTALVSGVLALIRSRFPDASADEVVTRLLATVQDLEEPGRDDATGYGLVRPYEALTAPVPPNATNPLYAGLDLTDTEDRDPRRYVPPSPPVIPPPPIVSSGGDDSSATVLILSALGAAVLAAVALTILLIVRASRRRPPHPPPYQ